MTGAQSEPPEQELGLFPEAAATPPQEDGEDFNWNRDDSVVIERQPRTAIYWNMHRHVVIRQEVDWPEDDVWITIDPVHLPDLIERLEQMKREAWK